MENSTTNLPKNDSSSIIDHIVKKWFPIIGVIFIVGGLAYLFYDGVWGYIDKSARIMVGFLAGILTIAGGYAMSHRLKNFADVIIGGGVLILYLTLIYGSRYEIGSQYNLLVIPEFASLVIAALFAAAISYYAYERKSKSILALGMLGGYLTPFFIGNVGTFEIGLPFIAYLLYFLAINVAIFVTASKLYLKSIGLLNSIGLFAGTISLALLLQGGFTEHAALSAIICVLITLMHIGAMVANAKIFTKEYDPFLLLGYVLPLVWMVFIMKVLMEDVLTTSVSIGIYAIIAVAYFGGWYYLRNVTDSDKHFGLYISGFLTIVVGLLELTPLLGIWDGALVSLVGFVWGILALNGSLIQRRVAYILVSIAGLLIALTHINDPETLHIWILRQSTVLTCIGLLPFLLGFFIRKERKDLQDLDAIEHILAVLASAFIIFLIFLDFYTLIDLPKQFTFFVLPASCLAIASYFLKTTESKSLAITTSIVLAVIGYASSCLEFFNNLYPSHTDLLFGSADSYIAVFCLLIFWNGVHWSKRLNLDIAFLAVFGFYLIFLQLVSNELIAVFNYFPQITQNPALQGLRAIILSVFWIATACFMIFKGTKHSKFMNDKHIGFGLFLVTILKIFFYDLANVNTNLKVFLFIIVGAIILGVSYYANKNDDDDK